MIAPRNDKQSLMRRHALFIAVFLIVAAARFTILLTSQTHVHSDEAIIGLMAQLFWPPSYLR